MLSPMINRVSGGLLLIILALLFSALVLVATSPKTLTIPTINEHATDKHPESIAINKCLQDNGPYMTYKAKGFDTFYLLCEFQPGKWGFQACTATGCTKTAYSPGDGSWGAVRGYLEKFATKFKGGLPWTTAN